MGREFELAVRTRSDLRIEFVADDPAVPAAGPTPDPDAEATRASSEIHRVLGRSLHLRHLDAGSCNACDWELAALLNPVYDVRRLGIDFVASPRHADGVVVTGPVTRDLETAVRRTFETVPDPRIVIAVGGSMPAACPARRDSTAPRFRAPGWHRSRANARSAARPARAARTAAAATARCV